MANLHRRRQTAHAGRSQRHRSCAVRAADGPVGLARSSIWPIKRRLVTAAALWMAWTS